MFVSIWYYTLALIAASARGFAPPATLQAVAQNVPLEAVTDGVGTIEVFLACLLAISPRVSVQIFVQKFPHVVGQGEDLKIPGVPVREKKNFENRFINKQVIAAECSFQGKKEF